MNPTRVPGAPVPIGSEIEQLAAAQRSLAAAIREQSELTREAVETIRTLVALQVDEGEDEELPGQDLGGDELQYELTDHESMD